MINKHLFNNAALVVTEATRGTSKGQLFKELGLDSLQQRRWYRKLCCLYIILKERSPRHIFEIIPKIDRPCSTRNANNVPHFKVKDTFFKMPFFSRQLSLNRKNQILKLKMPAVLIFLKVISQSFLDLPQTTYLAAIT